MQPLVQDALRPSDSPTTPDKLDGAAPADPCVPRPSPFARLEIGNRSQGSLAYSSAEAHKLLEHGLLSLPSVRFRKTINTFENGELVAVNAQQ